MLRKKFAYHLPSAEGAKKIAYKGLSKSIFLDIVAKKSLSGKSNLSTHGG